MGGDGQGRERQGAADAVRLGGARLGGVRHGEAGTDRTGKAGRGKDWLGGAGAAPHGRAR